ncbi:hypothetical protein [Aquabacterium sp.]|uniref:hypothetical protein n=1 Tax=Aquabacterium sp. TaxID=1872578 RepID=UPI003783204C
MNAQTNVPVVVAYVGDAPVDLSRSVESLNTRLQLLLLSGIDAINADDNDTQDCTRTAGLLALEQASALAGMLEPAMRMAEPVAGWKDQVEAKHDTLGHAATANRLRRLIGAGLAAVREGSLTDVQWAGVHAFEEALSTASVLHERLMVCVPSRSHVAKDAHESPIARQRNRMPKDSPARGVVSVVAGTMNQRGGAHRAL